MTSANRIQNRSQSDADKVKKPARPTRPKTETEDIEISVAERTKNRVVLRATERFIRSGIQIKDVYGKLGD